MQGTINQDDVEVWFDGKKLQCEPFTESQTSELMLPAYLSVSNGVHSVKIPLAQEVVEELKEKGFF